MQGTVTDYGSNFPNAIRAWVVFVQKARMQGILLKDSDQLYRLAQEELKENMKGMPDSWRDCDFLGILLKEKKCWEMWMDFVLSKPELYQKYLVESAKLRPILSREVQLMIAEYTTCGIELEGKVADLSEEERRQRNESSENCKEMWREIVGVYEGTDKDASWKVLLHKLEA